jgi:hypothetical protein
MEIEDSPLSNYVIALYVRKMICNENFINYLVKNEMKLSNFVKGISEIKDEDGATKKLLIDTMKELLKNKTFMNKVTENLDTISKMLKSDIVISLLEERSFIIDLVRTNKDFINHMAKIAGDKTGQLGFNIRVPENNDALLAICIEAMLRDGLTKIIDREEEVKTTIDWPVLCRAINNQICIK